MREKLGIRRRNSGRREVQIVEQGEMGLVWCWVCLVTVFP